MTEIKPFHSPPTVANLSNIWNERIQNELPFIRPLHTFLPWDQLEEYIGKQQLQKINEKIIEATTEFMNQQAYKKQLTKKNHKPSGDAFLFLKFYQSNQLNTRFAVALSWIQLLNDIIIFLMICGNTKDQIKNINIFAALNKGCQWEYGARWVTTFDYIMSKNENIVLDFDKYKFLLCAQNGDMFDLTHRTTWSKKDKEQYEELYNLNTAFNSYVKCSCANNNDSSSTNNNIPDDLNDTIPMQESGDEEEEEEEEEEEQAQEDKALTQVLVTDGVVEELAEDSDINEESGDSNEEEEEEEEEEAEEQEQKQKQEEPKKLDSKANKSEKKSESKADVQDKDESESDVSEDSDAVKSSQRTPRTKRKINVNNDKPKASKKQKKSAPSSPSPPPTSPTLSKPKKNLRSKRTKNNNK